MNSREREEFPEKAEAFLSDLRRISLKHGVVVSGCGCCGSPRLAGLSKRDMKTHKGRYKADPDYSRLQWE